ncbi:hypothetical protein [Sporomusa aerivorans]|uniref:hypothetical protein n=1 Tax=Sporomusa aerivorans TaxID=204936 RepID=UPI00352B27D1
MKRKVFECGILFLISVSYVIALLYDNDIFDPFVLLSNNIEDQMNTIFQVQASVATLGIALISLLAGSYKETIYGVPVSRFIMHIRPYILKHRNIILFELFLILISYISIIFNYYNSLITTFLISILLIGVMVYDIFKIFNGDKYIEEAIKEHCLSICEDGQLGEKQGILNVISDDIKYAVDNNYFSRVKKDLNILQDLFIIINNNQSDNHINKFWEENYISICSYIFEQEK